MFWGLCADAIAAIHFSYVAFVVLGELAILIGAALRQPWARNPWFRSAHLLAIGVVALEGYMHWPCPLTIWEYQFRTWAGQATTSETFIGRLVHLLFLDDLFEPWVYDYLHIAFGGLVLLTLAVVPPRWRRAQATARHVQAQPAQRGQVRGANPLLHRQVLVEKGSQVEPP
jgi:Protein of Unknown function (DUF2784)